MSFPRTEAPRLNGPRSFLRPQGKRKMSTLTTRILRRTELHRDTPLSKIIESFFIHNGMAAKTKEFYRGNFNAYVAWVKARIDEEPTLAVYVGQGKHLPARVRASSTS